MCDCLPPLILAVLLIHVAGTRPRLCLVLHAMFTFISCAVLSYIVYLYPKTTWDMGKRAFNMFVSVVATDVVNWGVVLVNDMAGTNFSQIVFTPL